MRFFKQLFTVALALFLAGPGFAMAAKGPDYGLHAIDSQPLGDRLPLILVHGINPNPKQQYGWAQYLAETQRHPAYMQRYKTYQFVYDPAAPVADSSTRMRRSLDDFVTTLPADRSMRIAALSLGGLLVLLLWLLRR